MNQAIPAIPQHLLSREPALSSPAPGAPRIATWQIFVLISLCTVAIGWVFNTWVLTRPVYDQLLGNQLDATGIDEHLNVVRRLQVWGYVATPVILALRLVGLTLFIQLFAILLFMAEPRYAPLFRAVSVAFAAVLIGSVFEVAWLAWLPASELIPETFQIAPGSFAPLLLPPESVGSTLYGLFSQFSLFDVLWVFLFCTSLPASREFGARRAAIAAISALMVANVTKWAIAAFLGSLNA